MIVQSIYVIFQIRQISVDVLLRYVDFDTLSKKYKKKQNPGLHPLGYSEKQQLTLQFALSTVVTDFLSTFPPSLQQFVEKFLKDYKAEVGRGHSIAGR